MRMLRKLAAIVAVAIVCIPISGRAQNFPEKPVRLIVNFAAGGPLDIVTRALGAKMATVLAQPFVVENRPGAGGNIGAAAVASSAPDGYTVLFSSDTTVTVNPGLYESMPFKLADLKALMVIASSGLVVSVHPDVGASSLAEFVSKGRTQTMTFSSSGNGGPGHIAAAMLQTLAGVKVNHIPYKGNPQAVMALLSGEVQAGVLGTQALLPHFQSGKVRALAVTTRKRLPLLPGTPTTAEAGLPGLVFEPLYVAFLPAAVPDGVASVLEQAMRAALAAPDVRERLRNLDIVVEGETGSAAAERLARARERYAATIRATGMKID